MGIPEYANYDALGLAELVRRREVSPHELVSEALARIDRVNPKLRAIVRTLPNEAAQTIQSVLSQSPASRGAFAGVPFLLKDFATAYAGVPLTNGSRLCRDFRPAHDAELVTRYKAAGLVVVGKTCVPEFALRPVCESKLLGATSTPWALGRTSGGSSGGSAAAVAAGIVPMAHGGDGGGSLRIPAACCGVFGFKPSRGRMPAGPDGSEQWWGYAIEHALTRTVRDSAALLDATCGATAGDFYQLSPPARPYLSEVGAAPGRLRILLVKQPFFLGPVHPDCITAVEQTGNRLVALGHEVEEGTIPLDREAFARDFLLLVGLEAAHFFHVMESLLGRKARKWEVEAATWLCRVMGRNARAEAWVAARSRLHAIHRQMAKIMETYDILLSPTLPVPPVEHGALQPPAVERFFQKVVVALNLNFLLRLPGAVDRPAKTVFSFMSFAPLANITGQPSMSLPLDWNEAGLPIGSLFSGRLGDEATLFRLAAQLESAHPWQHRRPPVHSDE